MSSSTKNLKPMNRQAMWDIGAEAVVNYLIKNNYIIDSVNTNCNTYPNIVAIKDNKLYGILIDANEVRKQPEYSIKGTFDMLRFARRFNAVPLYASIGIGSVNAEKFKNQILVDGDPEGYYVNFEGFKDIKYKIDADLSVIELKEYIINLLGYCYEVSDFSKIEKYIADDCKWYSFFSGYEYKSKKEIMNYYNKKSKLMKNTKMNYFLIKFIGDWFEIKVSELELPDGKKDHNKIVRIPQPGGEIGLVVEQIMDNDEKVGMAVTIGFNEKGLINDIYIGDPYAMKFNDYYKIYK